jgi:hypothetical protein
VRKGDRRFLWKVLRTRGQRRHVLRWLGSRDLGYFLDTPSPWLTFDAIDALTARMRDGMRVFEYGSGGSTLFWLRWKVELCSVEHEPEWYGMVKARLPAGAAVDYRLVEPEPLAQARVGGDPADPEAYLSADFRDRTFQGYASQIDPFPDGHFDLVLVDGRARPSCLRHAIPKVKPGGLLVLDNADRDYYVARLGDELRPFTHTSYAGVGPHNQGMWATDFYVRS